MRKRSKMKVNMYKTVRDWASSKLKELLGLKNLEDTLALLTDQLQLIDELDAKVNHTSKGYTSAKKAIRKELEKTIILIVAMLRNAATFSQNVILFHEIDFRDSTFKTVSEQMLASRVEFILGKARANQEIAEPYGLTPEVMARAEGLLKEFRASVTSPRQVVVGTVDVNARLAEAISEADSLVKDKLDQIMKLVKFDKPTLYGQYKSARVIIDR